MAKKSFDGIDGGAAEKSGAEADLPSIHVDFGRATGPVKPLHGINNSPMTYGEPLPDLRDAGIPYVRLHDVGGEFGGTYFVDVPNVFPNFDADPDEPSSYDFAFTDAYLAGLISSGVKIFYRLGVTIENNWRIKAHRIHPPSDFEKWARICAGIIRHYNEGWAGGFEYQIQYWEIWNEPENPPMWTGTREQYFELYRVASNFLKSEFPSIKIGGYASCGFYAVNRPEAEDFHKSFLTYFDEFLKYITSPATSAPLDFFSWHLYTTDPREIAIHAEYVAGKLAEYGLDRAENVFNEWNGIDWQEAEPFEAIKEMPGATFTAAAFCVMQDSRIDKAMYYDALPSRTYCGLFYFPSGRVTKTYYAFKAFNELFALGTAVECGCRGADTIFICAAKDDDGKGSALVVNLGAEERNLRLLVSGPLKFSRCLTLDASRTLTETNVLLEDGTLKLPRQSVQILRFQ